MNKVINNEVQNCGRGMKVIVRTPLETRAIVESLQINGFPVTSLNGKYECKHVCKGGEEKLLLSATRGRGTYLIRYADGLLWPVSD